MLKLKHLTCINHFQVQQNTFFLSKQNHILKQWHVIAMDNVNFIKKLLQNCILYYRHSLQSVIKDYDKNDKTKIVLANKLDIIYFIFDNLHQKFCLTHFFFIILTFDHVRYSCISRNFGVVLQLRCWTLLIVKY